MNIYYDGGWKTKFPDEGWRAKKDLGQKPILSWGFRIEGGSEPVEVYGSLVMKTRAEVDKANGLHETIALVEAVLYASSHEISPHEITFITDDEVAVYGAQSEGCVGHSNRNAALHEQLNRACIHYYSDNIKALVWTYLTGSRFVKVKGHCVTVNNLRVDYLSRYAQHLIEMKAANKQPSPLIPFEQWAQSGFAKYNQDGIKEIWYPPFVEARVTKTKPVTD